MYSLAYVRHTIDTTDEFYDKEMEYLDQTLPLCQEVGTELGKAMLASPFRAQLEKKFGPVLFKNLELQQKSFSPAIIPDLQEENRLVTEYGKLIASAQIPFEGGVHTLSQLTPFKSDRTMNAGRRLGKQKVNSISKTVKSWIPYMQIW